MNVEFVLVRIDDRLIHGQVAIGWVKAVSPTVLIVANDAVAADPLQRSLMEMAAPPTLKVDLVTVDELPALLERRDMQGQRVLLLLASPRDALRVVEAGVPIGRVNVGGLRFQPGKRQVLRAVSLDDQDAACLRSLLDHRIRVFVQMVPTDDPLPIEDVL